MPKHIDDENFDALGRPKKVKREMSDWSVIKRIFQFVGRGKYSWLLVLLILISIAGAVLNFLTPRFIQEIINDGLGGGVAGFEARNDIIILNVKRLGVAIILSIGFWFFQSYSVQTIANRSMYEMRASLYKNLQKLSFDYYNAPNRSTGKIISYLTNDVETIQELIQSGILSIFGRLFSLFGSLVMMIILSWKLTLISFAILPVILILARFIFKNVRQYYILMRRKVSAVTGHLNESITGMRVIKAFGVEDDDAHKFDVLTDAELSVNLKAQKIFSMIPAGVTSIIGVVVGVMVGSGAYFYLTGTMQTGDILAFALYLIAFMEPVVSIMSLFSMIQNSMSAGERIVKVIDTKTSIDSKPDAIQLSSIDGEISFEEVDFEYLEDIPIIKKFSLDIKPKERVAIIGYTGAGKTTIINLICRFYDVTTGKIKVDGNDLRDVELESLRKKIGLVLQDNMLFPGTVKDNIRYGRPDASDEEVIAAAKKVGAHEYILDLKEGYDSEVREFGNILSVGQKQLIAFARALLIDPPILILDEATSAVDPYSELIIQQALETLLKGRTSISIAHRLSTIVNSDRIIVMDQGEIIEQGNHDALMAMEDGIYRHLFKMQFKDPFKNNANGKSLKDLRTIPHMEE